MKYRFVAVEGPIGVGKTSLVNLLAERFGAAKVSERIENPFLRDFYRDKPGAALQDDLPEPEPIRLEVPVPAPQGAAVLEKFRHVTAQALFLHEGGEGFIEGGVAFEEEQTVGLFMEEGAGQLHLVAIEKGVQHRIVEPAEG